MRIAARVLALSFTDLHALVLLLAVALTMAGCSSTPLGATVQDPNGNPDALRAFTLADLATAEADAKASGDLISEPCYAALSEYIGSLPALAPGSGATVGAATLFQKGRDLVNPYRAGIPTSLVLGCGPLASQVRLDVLTFLTKVASGAAISVVAPPLAPLLAQ